MVAFLPILYYVAAGLATAATLTGCATHGPLPKPKLSPATPPQPPKRPEESRGPEFPMGALALGDEAFTDGYSVILKSVSENLTLLRGNSIPLQGIQLFDTRNDKKAGLLLNSLIEDPGRAAVTKKFLERVASFDGKPEEISSYDYLFSSFYLYSTQWGGNWQEKFFFNEELFPFSMAEHIKTLAGPLVEPYADKTVASQSRQMLQSLALYLQGFDPSDSNAKLLPLMDFFLNGKEPQNFSDYFKVLYKEFLSSSDEKKAEIFQKAITAQWPSHELLEALSPYLQQNDMILLTSVCFKKDAKAAFPLFEELSLPRYFSLRTDSRRWSDEVKIFPSLPQDHPFPDRQKVIDDFLGAPLQVWEKKYPGTGTKTTVKKYQWAYETEVFSIESGKPGPTTLVFSPHFHEPNPRKYFHWLKDLPLQTGRVIFLPEANHAMRRAGLDTVPMNRIFNQALLSQRIDHVLVRRVEYLMGLVDGVIGDHDAGNGPFYISDILIDQNGNGSAALSPKGSPWIPKEVTKIEEIDYGPPPKASSESYRPDPTTLGKENQLQWQIADYSRKRLRKLAGRDFSFVPENIQDESSHSVMTTTGYVQWRLGKPAMTFEGHVRKEHGQLHAMAIYTLLLGFGHKISPQFEKKLKDPLPKMEPELYRGNHVTLTNLPEEKPEPGK